MPTDHPTYRRQFSLRRLFFFLTLLACMFGSVRMVGWNSLIYFGWSIGAVVLTRFAAASTKQSSRIEQFLMMMLATGIGSFAGTYLGALFAAQASLAMHDASSAETVHIGAIGAAMASVLLGIGLMIVSSFGALVSTRTTSTDHDDNSAASECRTSFGRHTAVILSILFTLGWLFVVFVQLFWT